MTAPQCNNRYRVFFSHGSEDVYIVSDFLAPQVRSTDAEVFVDNGAIHYGDDFRHTVFAELERCDEVLVLLTPSSVRRPWVFAELGAAGLRRLRVVALRYGVSMQKLQQLGILSILGSNLPIVIDDMNDYVEQLRVRVQHRANGHG